MLLIEWNRPCTVGIGDLKLGPGVNEIKNNIWENANKKYARQIKGYIEQKDIIVHDGDKPTQATVAKTYNIDLLEDWLLEAKGPLKGAIKKQIAFLTKDEKKQA